MYLLQLNPITANAERVVPICYASTIEELETFLRENIVEPYRDGYFIKHFRKGSILENYNPPDDLGESWINVPSIVYIGTVEEWMENARIEYYNFLDSLISI